MSSAGVDGDGLDAPFRAGRADAAGKIRKLAKMLDIELEAAEGDPWKKTGTTDDTDFTDFLTNKPMKRIF